MPDGILRTVLWGGIILWLRSRTLISSMGTALLPLRHFSARQPASHLLRCGHRVSQPLWSSQDDDYCYHHLPQTHTMGSVFYRTLHNSQCNPTRDMGLPFLFVRIGNWVMVKKNNFPNISHQPSHDSNPELADFSPWAASESLLPWSPLFLWPKDVPPISGSRISLLLHPW